MSARTPLHAPPSHEGIAHFPREIRRFFTGEPGQTLLVNGAPGTGKTLFTIRGLDVLSREGDVLYVSTRVDQETVYEMYVEGHAALDRTALLDLSQDPFGLPMDVDVPFETLNLESLLSWVDAISAPATNLTLAFDSWRLVYEYLAARHDSPPSIETVTNQLVALARDAGVRLVLVSETATQSPLEYIVDGVVTLHVTDNERGRTRRQLRLEKLRGVRIENRLQPFTLADGQFKAITPVELSTTQSVPDEATWEPLANPTARFSTGIRDLDTILSGGFNRGGVVHLDLGADLSRDAWSVLVLPAIRNFLANEMGVAVVPPKEGSPGLLHNDLSAVLSKAVFDTHCHVFETYAGPTRDHDDAVDPDRLPGHDTTPTEHGTLSYDPYIAHAERIREHSDGPLLHVISMDTAHHAFETRLGDFANYVALHNDASVLITKPGTALRTRADRVADMHFRLECAGDAIVLYGETPLTPLLGIGVDQSGTIPEITLTEMV